jgi:hypothetical protein
MFPNGTGNWNRYHGCPRKEIDKLFQNRKLNKHKDCFKPVPFQKTLNLFLLETAYLFLS